MSAIAVPTISEETIFGNPHEWPESLYVVALPDGKYAANQCDTNGFERDPMRIKGLSTHRTEKSVEAYLKHHAELPIGKAESRSYEECRAIALARGLDTLLLMEGPKILDMEFLS